MARCAALRKLFDESFVPAEDLLHAPGFRMQSVVIESLPFDRLRMRRE
jgi:hypothetical protein